MKIPKPILKKPSLHFLNVLIPNTKRGIIIFIIFLSLVILGGLLLANYLSSDKKQERDISQKIETLNEENSSCEQVIDDIGNYSTDNTDKEEDKKVLLEKQMLCFGDARQYDKAISVGEELKEFYNSRSDSDNTRRIEMQIQGLKEVKKYHEEEAKFIENGNEEQ
ncbi:MAG TPA: hypothetical protein VD947_03905 [Patescibacteria group bacterium]|nr:hypothetical protein [Patescibacteria group bacterium]